MRSLLLFLIFLSVPAEAGYTRSVKTVSLDYELPTRRDEKPRCVGGGGGISDAANVALYTRTLRDKAAKLPLDLHNCEFDGEQIVVMRSAGGFTTSVDGHSELVYASGETAVNRLVMAKGETWTPPVCPPGTTEAIMNEQLRRVFACYPEDGHHVTTRAEDETARKAREAAALRNMQ